MASTKAYLDFVLEQLSGLDEVRFRAMMGEYILYIAVKCSAVFMMTGTSFVSCLAQTVNAFFAGAMFGAIYLRGGSLWAVIFLHGLYDIAASVTNLFTKTYGADMLTSMAGNQETSFIKVLTSNPLSLVYIVITLFLLRKSKCDEVIFDF